MKLFNGDFMKSEYCFSIVFIKGNKYNDENLHFRHLLTDSGITTTTIEEAIVNATSKIIIFAVPKGN